MAHNTAPRKRAADSSFSKRKVSLRKEKRATPLSNVKSPLKVVHPQKSKSNHLLIVVICFIFIVGGWKGAEFLDLNADGEIVLSAARQEKFAKELKELQEGEQYVLFALRYGKYPCYNCPDSSTITLFPREVWKYGMTTKGQSGRYPNGLPAPFLYYDVQFTGTIQDCLIEEKRKIYQYALRPENLKRKTPIIRPPGNKQDN